MGVSVDGALKHREFTRYRAAASFKFEFCTTGFRPCTIHGATVLIEHAEWDREACDQGAFTILIFKAPITNGQVGTRVAQ